MLPTIRLALEEHGYFFTDDEVHEYLKRRFLSETRFNKRIQTEYTVIKSTADINQVAFNECIEKCREFSLDSLGTYVLNSNEYLKGEGLFRNTESNEYGELGVRKGRRR